jgi:cyclase
MSRIRVIPCLDISNGRVVKGVKFRNIKDAGDPVEIAAAYSQSGADELVLLDISAGRQGRKMLLDLVGRIAEQISVPFTVGGGIGSIKDMEDVFRAGADRISVNSAALRRPEIISEAAERFGSKSIMVAIDARRGIDGGYEVYSDGGNTKASLDALEWAREAELLGAGEILLTSMDTDGTRDGYDIHLTKSVARTVQIPVIASGGAGSPEHFYRVVVEGGASGVLAASLFHYGELAIMDVKRYLQDKGVPVNMEINR